MKEYEFKNVFDCGKPEDLHITSIKEIQKEIFITFQENKDDCGTLLVIDLENKTFKIDGIGGG